MDVEDIEIRLFIQAMQLRHGHDFSGYAPASLKRRVLELVRMHATGTISELNRRVLHDEGFVGRVIEGLSVPVSEMFRDPFVFKTLRETILPVLASHPQINVWQAGCAQGQEVYSLAILLEEEGLYERTRIYATDFNDAALAAAGEGIYATRDARDWSRNYLEAGGKRSFSDYYSARYDFIKLDQRLRRNVTFFNHNLVTDVVFCEAHLILCRNVLIYFGNALQDRTLGLFRDSLVRGGFLCLGTRENIDFSPLAADFQEVDSAARIYRVGNQGTRPSVR
ncbi:CheR family methyltransferase [Luteibacter sp. UNCMF366Tsu5.1]|uniref:CheR family methyltransferase n=1 Tax=Luteibacter sp. UNCMF366Tsu5.1 TaxID=1502758 RepID=UPI000908965F|nr:CheR family methyltransferase [Luteibacter sp. UNCMF366Tsu5.1]SFW39315.1 chemotaxis protein methyltransferase CheR [Luteibacter sp. UNCMF366Tsu5.1]